MITSAFTAFAFVVSVFLALATFIFCGQYLWVVGKTLFYTLF